MIPRNRILLVDDDPSGLAMLGLALKRADFDVETASGSEEALRLLRRKPFDWMVTDARMHPLDGFRLTLEAKRLQPSLRVVMVSAVAGDGDLVGYPIERLFPKPVAEDGLVGYLRGPNGASAPQEAG